MTSQVPSGVETGPLDEPGFTQTPQGGEGGGKPRSLTADAWRDLRRNPVFIIAGIVSLVILSMAAVPGLWTSVDPTVCDLAHSREGTQPGHPFGYDAQGCDLYSQVIHGARNSIAIGLLVTGATLVLAVILGTLSAFYGGWVDPIVQRLADVFLAIPYILGGILILSRLGIHNVWSVSLALSLFVWPTQTRVMRGSVLAVKNSDYVQAARALGASDVRIMFRHIMPNAIASVLVLSTLLVGSIIGAEAALTFLGVGLQYPAISWGVQLSEARTYFVSSPHLMIYPALFLTVTVLAFIAIGDAVRDAFDPKLR